MIYLGADPGKFFWFHTLGTEGKVYSVLRRSVHHILKSTARLSPRTGRLSRFGWCIVRVNHLDDGTCVRCNVCPVYTLPSENRRSGKAWILYYLYRWNQWPYSDLLNRWFLGLGTGLLKTCSPNSTSPRNASWFSTSTVEMAPWARSNLTRLCIPAMS